MSSQSKTHRDTIDMRDFDNTSASDISKLIGMLQQRTVYVNGNWYEWKVNTNQDWLKDGETAMWLALERPLARRKARQQPPLTRRYIAPEWFGKEIDKAWGVTVGDMLAIRAEVERKDKQHLPAWVYARELQWWNAMLDDNIAVAPVYIRHVLDLQRKIGLKSRGYPGFKLTKESIPDLTISLMEKISSLGGSQAASDRTKGDGDAQSVQSIGSTFGAPGMDVASGGSVFRAEQILNDDEYMRFQIATRIDTLDPLAGSTLDEQVLGIADGLSSLGLSQATA
ncbi:hypothetical protein FFLO_02920 [Filobasidium floriforme]|uniref:Uncharacterized protein n=1 Tax=Filobasidium floriforme TaxID=5210 RepID=A0A8K0NNP5_9TREE|nr:hypothetical protein FFLO_02920 [Filobasidium floriforme]